MKALKFFDCDTRIGDTLRGSRPGTAELLAEMDRCGIERALVGHNNWAFGALDDTNGEVAEAVAAGAGRLTGVWCILPTCCGECPPPEKWFADMRRNNIGAITLYPEEHRYELSRLSLGGIMTAAAARRVPVILDFFGEKYDLLYEFMELFPETVCIARGAYKFGCDRYLRPLLETYAGFRFAFSGYWVPEGIRDLAEKFGAERLLFGSGFPLLNPGSAMLQLRHSGLNDADVARIAAGNLEKLLSEARL